ncbi:RHS repeat domain-containing protein [Winogradskyella luteola]|uniref:RHS repeat protein n=1 Tax=Winogradskyella luteola TaxID=2828330 RepID=A0A9X1JS32_9FLAO|nr:RHS repeat domain-containing protein [Winogradskyella luteola]MBV7269212.1 RHS repeat protein [Winogradskyella luteola]
MKRHVILSIAALLFMAALPGQELPNVIPPSPEAAELIKYSQTQISPYTGLPNIQIPFYTIKHDGVFVPISLAYSGGGIKVADIASWVGLGWNLQAGGLVSRTINWLPDDKELLGYMYNSYDMAHFRANPDSSWACCDPNEQSHQLLGHMAAQRDYEPDDFNYSIPGYSGSFYFDQDLDDFVQRPYTNVKIEKLGDTKITGFKITTPDGVMYHFGGSIEYLEQIRGVKTMSLTTSGAYSGENDNYVTDINPYYQSWMLRKIEFPTSSALIKFEYDLEHDVKTIIKSNEEFMPWSNSSNTMEYRINYSEKKFTQPKVKTITFPTGSLEFNRSTLERLDLENSYSLERITLLNSQGKIMKEMKLETSQSDAIPDNEYPFFRQSNEFYKRLRLDKVSIQNALGEDNEEYVLEYNPQKLPHRFSRSIDYFGYFNGKDNIDLIPKANYYTSIPTAYWGKADRSVQPAYTQAEVLTKITYPTGGYEEFIWENNSISFFSQGSTHQYKDYLLEYSKMFHGNGCMFEDLNPSNNFDYSMIIDIPEHSNGIVEFDISIQGCSYEDDRQVLNDTNCSYMLYLIDVTDAPNSPQILLEPKAIKFLTPGNTYKIAATYNGNFQGCEVLQTESPNIGGFSALIKYTEDPTPGEYMYSGLRIKELKTFDDTISSTPQLWKKYDYTYHENSATPSLTSGKAYRLPINYIANYRSANNSSDGQSYAEGYQIFSNAPLVPINGALQGYLNVTESHHGQSDTNGGIRYTFSEFDFGQYFPYSGTYFDSPFPDVHKKIILSNWRNGNLIKTEYFDKENRMVKAEYFEYENANTFNKDPWDFAVQVFRMPDLTTVVNDNTITFDNNIYVSLYGYTTEHHRLKSQTTTDYLDGGDVTVTQTHTYDNNPLLASGTITTGSDGNVRESHVTYAQDLQSPTLAEQMLVDQNRFEPVRTEQTVGDTNGVLAQSASRTVYHNFGGGQVLPQKIETLKGEESPTNPSEERIRFHRYNGKGKPMEVSKAGGTHIIYIWGYNNTQPVAKIENASYQGMSSDLFTAIAAAKNASLADVGQSSETALRAALDSLRSHPELSDAMVTTYAYDPLVGVTSITDPRGQTVHYEYDEFNRLKYVKDEDGNILSQNAYHYRTQN